MSEPIGEADVYLNYEDSNENFAEEEDVHVANPLALAWSFGLNRHIPVLNLCKASDKIVFYVTSNAGVIFDWKNNKQTLLQGHCNAINCCCVSNDKRWLVTADIGTGNTTIIWDTNFGVPIRTLFDVFEDGVKCVALSHDAKFLATLSCSVPQELKVWDWTTEREEPLCSITLEEHCGLQTYIKFHPTNPQHLVSNNKNHVVFYFWENEKLSKCAPQLSDKDFNKAIGLYSQSIFQSETDFALTATSCGNIVVWTRENGNPGCERKAFKVIRAQESAITILVQHHGHIVTGDTIGSVKFFDQSLKLVNWYNQLEGSGSINSLSFSYRPQKDVNKLKTQSKKNYPASATLAAAPFVVTDFIVGTVKASVIHFKTKGSQAVFIKQEHDNDITAIACHPTEPRICIGSHSGLVQLWDFEKRLLLSSRRFLTGDQVTSAAFGRLGNPLALGYSDGRVKLVDGLALTDEGSKETPANFHHSHDAITKLAFSHDSTYLASTDLDRCVAVYKANPGNKAIPWSYLGKQRAHYKKIVDLCFGKVLDEDKPRLLSLGEDRVLAEYDLENSTVDNLQMLTADRIEQSAVPTCFTWYPPIVKEDFLVFANNQFKLKLFNSTTKMCRKTVLGPTYGSPLRKMCVLPGENGVNYMSYITTDKIGLMILPLDGNPHKSVAMIAHPGKVYDMVPSYDGKYVFTAGGHDCSVLMWKIDIDALEATAKLGGDGLIPFYGLLDGGRDGELFAELEDYFYYAQMRSQGIDSIISRDVSTKIPLEEVPFLMRALGYYPTEQEIDDMLNEIKFSSYVETGQYVTDVDLGDCIQLYVNHRPAFGLSQDDLCAAFETLGVENDKGEPAIERQTLLDLLQSKGEHLTEAEMAEYMGILLGIEEVEYTKEHTPQALSQYNGMIMQQLPQETTADLFASELLGLQSDAT